jgi:hypothetical protein
MAVYHGEVGLQIKILFLRPNLEFAALPLVFPKL